jgi:Protein of unknown function (DUF664)
MTLVEGWFHAFDGRPRLRLYCTDENPDGDFDAARPDGADEDLAALHASVDRSRDAVAGRSLDELVPGSTGEAVCLRWVYQHMIEEYARHNGHADLLRERIDGVTGD